MLSFLRLQNVGPAPEMEMRLRPRLNLITGDNGLGKSFLMDVAWWVLTRNWVGEPAFPTVPEQAAISYAFDTLSGRYHQFFSEYRRKTRKWTTFNAILPRPRPGLVIYAHVDGGFSIWDPTRNYRGMGAGDPETFVLSARETWEGNEHCSGLLADWVEWEETNSPSFLALRQVMDALSADSDAPIIPGPTLRSRLRSGPKQIPTLRMPYHQDVPLAHASAGVRRIAGLAYLLTWAWHGHLADSMAKRRTATDQIIVLVDEIEAHLHPKWQRRIARALLTAVESLSVRPRSKVDVQILAATHSPLVLASLEPVFNSELDAWFDLDLENGRVVLRNREYIRRGEIDNWLTSPAFDLKEPRGSEEAEVAIQEALGLMRQPERSRERIEEVDRLLREALGDTDRFWVRWCSFRDGGTDRLGGQK